MKSNAQNAWEDGKITSPLPNHEFSSTTQHSMSKSREKSLIQRAQKSHLFSKSKAGRKGGFIGKKRSFKNRRKKLAKSHDDASLSCNLKEIKQNSRHCVKGF